MEQPQERPAEPDVRREVAELEEAPRLEIRAEASRCRAAAQPWTWGDHQIVETDAIQAAKKTLDGLPSKLLSAPLIADEVMSAVKAPPV